MRIHGRIGYDGREIYKFTLPWQGKLPEQVTISGNVADHPRDRAVAQLDGRSSGGILAVAEKSGQLEVRVVPFPASCAFTLRIDGAEYTCADGEISVDWADKFQAFETNGLRYRLYTPETGGSRPLILFLHGGGESGFDNLAQIQNCFGAAKLAESYPDCYVLAPQAPGVTPEPEMLEQMKNMTFATSDRGIPSAWSRPYLAKVADLIREMIAQGKANPERIYVTGMSMGGGGTLRMLNVAGDLFAAAVCICPTMTPETYEILRNLTHTKIWVTCAYLDHTYYRHKYITDAILELRDGGNRDAKLTIFAPEELEKYGISILRDMPLEQKAGWNHACWVPTYCNEHGVMSWMMNQRKR